MKCKTQSQVFPNVINIFITEPGEYYGKCLGSTTSRSLANSIRKLLRENKITMAEAIKMLGDN